jgi:hypothetical protein
MTEHGATTDEWPALHDRVMAADILVLMTPIWLGQISSVCARGNLIHLARMLRHEGGIPAHGNRRSEWDAGCRPDATNPEHR